METENKDGEQERRGELEWRSWPLCRGGEEGSCVHKESRMGQTARPSHSQRGSSQQEGGRAESRDPRPEGLPVICLVRTLLSPVTVGV